MNKFSRHPIVSSVLVGLIAVTLVAVTVQPSHAVARIVKLRCKDDWKRLCPAYSPGSARMRACMEAKAKSISLDCVRALIDSGEVDRSRASSYRK